MASSYNLVTLITTQCKSPFVGTYSRYDTLSYNACQFLTEIEWRKKAAEQGKPVEDDEFEDLTEDAKRLQEQELEKVKAAVVWSRTHCPTSIHPVKINIPHCLSVSNKSDAGLGIFSLRLDD